MKIDTLTNTVVLKLPKSMIVPSGYIYGQQIYDEQIKNKINPTSDFCIVFPKQIRDMTQSFIYGLFKSFVDENGLDIIRCHAYFARVGWDFNIRDKERFINYID